MSLLTYGPTFHHAIPVCEYLAQYGLLRSRRDVFQLDSATPRMKVADYFKLENRFKMLEMNDKPRVVEEHDGWAGVFSADAGTRVAIASDPFSYAFSGRVNFCVSPPEPQRVPIGIISRKGKLSPAAEKFCQCATEAFVAIR